MTQIDEERPKSISKVSERAKKKAWYSVLYPSYKSRTEDFKKLFKGVPDDERLVVGENIFFNFFKTFNVAQIRYSKIIWRSCVKLRFNELFDMVIK